MLHSIAAAIGDVDALKTRISRRQLRKISTLRANSYADAAWADTDS